MYNIIGSCGDENHFVCLLKLVTRCRNGRRRVAKILAIFHRISLCIIHKKTESVSPFFSTPSPNIQFQSRNRGIIIFLPPLLENSTLYSLPYIYMQCTLHPFSTSSLLGLSPDLLLKRF